MRIADVTLAVLLGAVSGSLSAQSVEPTAADVIPADTSSWMAEIVPLSGGGGGHVYGQEGRTRLDLDDGSQRIHDPETTEVLLFDETSEHGTIESDWRFPWLLSEGILAELRVRVTASRPERVADEDVTCRDLEGADDYGAWMRGTVCTTPDGIHMRLDLKGGHNLEGGDEIFPWSAAYELRSLVRGDVPAELFQRPAHVTEWVAPG